MPLIGTLRDLSLASLVQLQCSERRHARLVLIRGGHEGLLIFADGDLVFASVGSLAGEKAVHELLTWDDADFRVDHEAVTVQRNVRAPWPALLLDGARLMDEARAERDAEAESWLRGIRGQHGLRAALLVNGEGRVRATAAEAQAAGEAARLAFLAGRLESVAATLNCGAFVEALLTARTEKLWIAKQDGSYLVCWMDGRASPQPLAAQLRPLFGGERAVATR